MRALRRALYLQAAVWAVAGVALVLAPRFLLVTLFGQPDELDDAWLRLLGANLVGLAMLMVLVGHRVTDLWWWSWAFAIVTVATAVILVLNAAFGLAPGQSGLLWWLSAVIAVALALNLLYGLFASSQENPVP